MIDRVQTEVERLVIDPYVPNAEAGEARVRLLADFEEARLQPSIVATDANMALLLRCFKLGLRSPSCRAFSQIAASATVVSGAIGIDEEAATVKLLKDVLDDARAEASRTFIGPVAQRARVHVERLFPGADLSFDEELGLASVTRSGLSEACGTLSKGTQEQLAVLTRLAFADMLLEQGLPVSLILDDPLVYSDDGRLDLMTEILEEASQRMQVILLTCRDRAFRHLAATRVQL